MGPFTISAKAGPDYHRFNASKKREDETGIRKMMMATVAHLDAHVITKKLKYARIKLFIILDLSNIEGEHPNFSQNSLLPEARLFLVLTGARVASINARIAELLAQVRLRAFLKSDGFLLFCSLKRRMRVKE